MYNFLDPKLTPKVSCDSPSTDNYEATNLISEKEAIRARGFLAYTIIKPPVSLEFEFICPINIAYIAIDASVGTQRCRGIEILSKTPSGSYQTIGRAIFDKSGVLFCNNKTFSKSNPPPCYNNNIELCYFKNDKYKIFTETSAVKIVIFRTARSVPCLGSVKIFGDPARICSQVTVSTINRIMGGCSKQSLDTKSNNDNGLKIPEDFLDALTCEIMAIPITLPSGKSVDRDTLEKYIENEKSFGRKPGDPFTGLKFTENRKPVMNSALKSRIDMFLLQNANNSVIYGVKRTLGGGNECNNKRIRLNSEKCCLCREEEGLYIIPCKHFYCRPCLLNLKSLKCYDCQKIFVRGSAERYYN